MTTREDVRWKYLFYRKRGPFNKVEIQNLKNYRDQMADILSNLGFKWEREQKKFYDAVDIGFIDVAKVLYELLEDPNICGAFLEKHHKSEVITIVKALNDKLYSYKRIDGAEGLSIIDDEPDEVFFKGLEKQDQSKKFEWVKAKYILFMKHEFPKSKEYHTHITEKSPAKLAEELQVYNPDDPGNKGKHLKDSALFTEYCEKAPRSKNLEDHHTQFAIKIRRFLTNIKVEAQKGGPKKWRLTHEDRLSG